MPRWKRWLVLLLLTAMVVPPLLFAGWAWASLKYVYASGERAGFVQKISRKGWLCKTWEGELAMVNLPGTMPEIFSFTVRDDAAAHDIERMIGQRVQLSYEQHKGVPGPCFGETEYFVTRVVSIANDKSPAPAVKPAVSPTST